MIRRYGTAAHGSSPRVVGRSSPLRMGKKGWMRFGARRGEIDVVLLDLMMPGLSGMEVLEQSLQTDPDLLVIVITGYATVESAVEAMKKGAYDFIAKPFTPDQLRIVVKRALERRALQKEAAFLRQEREKSLRDIATEKSKIKTIIHSMGDGVLVCDQDGSLVLTNPAANRMLQLSEDHLLGKLLTEVHLPPELASAIDKSLKTVENTFTSISQELSVGDGGGSSSSSPYRSRTKRHRRNHGRSDGPPGYQLSERTR